MQRETSASQVILIAALAALASLIGCSDELPLADAGGVVTYKGKPVPGATITFMSEDGPLAIGTTDQSGRFELNTLGRPGAAIGRHGVAVSLMKDDREITPAEAETMKTEDLNRIRKSLIPAKYAHPRTSGLEATVGEDSDNRFTFELTD